MSKRLNFYILGLILIYPFLYSKSFIDPDVYKYSLFGLVTLISITSICSFIIFNKNQDYKPSYWILIIVFGIISSQIIGQQTHHSHQGALAGFKAPRWVYQLSWLYPVAFLIFTYYLGRVNNHLISFLVLIAWTIGTGLTGFIFTTSGEMKPHEDFVSHYLPSGWKEITAIIMIAVTLLSLILLAKTIIVKRRHS